MYFLAATVLALGIDSVFAFQSRGFPPNFDGDVIEVLRERRDFQFRNAHRHVSPYPRRQATDCISSAPASSVTTRMQAALVNEGDVLSLCPNEQYLILEPLNFTAPNQEISTINYPTDDTRGVIVVNGIVFNGTGHTTAVNGQCNNCDGCMIRNVQINGTRGDAVPTQGNALIEMGGPTSGQLIEYVHSWNPRSWSCLHIAEGPFTCNNVTVVNNDIGPCGTQAFQQWADGISLSCQNSYVAHNFIENPTDGGIVVFGSPGSLVENNTIWVVNNTLLGGINMVDFDPWNGNYTNTVVRENLIVGGYATDRSFNPGDPDGSNGADVIVKIGMAVGPRTWFGEEYNNSVNSNGTAYNNELSGAMGYAIAISSSYNFTVWDNILTGNTSFIGAVGPNCSSDQVVPTPEPFVYNSSTTTLLNISSGFVDRDSDSLTCILPPDGGDYWPYGGEPNPSVDTPGVPNSEEGGSGTSAITGSLTVTATLAGGSPGASSSPGSTGSSSSGISSNAAVALGVGLGASALVALIAGLIIRKWMRDRRRRNSLSELPAEMKERNSSWQDVQGPYHAM